jgi:hypothetical protein
MNIRVVITLVSGTKIIDFDVSTTLTINKLIRMTKTTIVDTEYSLRLLFNDNLMISKEYLSNIIRKFNVKDSINFTAVFTETIHIGLKDRHDRVTMWNIFENSIAQSKPNINDYATFYNNEFIYCNKENDKIHINCIDVYSGQLKYNFELYINPDTPKYIIYDMKISSRYIYFICLHRMIYRYDKINKCLELIIEKNHIYSIDLYDDKYIIYDNASTNSINLYNIETKTIKTIITLDNVYDIKFKFSKNSIVEIIKSSITGDSYILYDIESENEIQKDHEIYYDIIEGIIWNGDDYFILVNSFQGIEIYNSNNIKIHTIECNPGYSIITNLLKYGLIGIESINDKKIYISKAVSYTHLTLPTT